MIAPPRPIEECAERRAARNLCADPRHDDMPHVYVIGGPNGAGKSTSARLLLPSYLGVREFVNADEIAKGLSAFAPESVAFEAGRIMLRRLRELAEMRVSFAFETTLATRTFVPWLLDLRDRNFEVVVIYLWLPTVRLSIQRVARRVHAGGHHVPEEVVRRRYTRGRINFLDLYAPLADAWRLFDSSGDEPVLIAHGGRGGTTTILREDSWQRVNRRSP